MKFGFVGLGQMGAPMAINLAKAYDVTIFDSKKETLDGINVILKLEIENIKFSLMLPDEWKLSPTDYNIDKINQSRNFHSIELIY